MARWPVAYIVTAVAAASIMSITSPSSPLPSESLSLSSHCACPPSRAFYPRGIRGDPPLPHGPLHPCPLAQPFFCFLGSPFCVKLVVAILPGTPLFARPEREPYARFCILGPLNPYDGSPDAYGAGDLGWRAAGRRGFVF